MMDDEDVFEADTGDSVTQTFSSSYSPPLSPLCRACLLVSLGLPLPGGRCWAEKDAARSEQTTHQSEEGHLIVLEAETFEATLLSRFSLDPPSSAASLLHLKETDSSADLRLLLALDLPSPSLCLFQGSSPLIETETDEVAPHSSSSRSSRGNLCVVQTLTGPAPFRQIHALQQSPDAVGPRALCVADSEKCTLFSCREEEFQALGILQKEHTTCEAAAWDPHDASVLLTAHSKSRFPFLRRTGGSSGGFLALWDLRQPLSESAAAAAAASGNGGGGGGSSSCMRLADEVEDPHSLRASPTTVCFNPNIPFCFISGGTDGAIRCWDKRKLQLPVKVVRDVHSHWVSHAILNPFHDELLLTAGKPIPNFTQQTQTSKQGSTDGCLKLQRLEMELAAPSHGVHTPESLRSETGKRGQDQVLCVDESSDDSLAALCWSYEEAWTFASLGIDGKLSFHQIPAAEKYRILL
ncbi:hypothetical protein Esti_000313 [Eimeria stiedai]